MENKIDFFENGDYKLVTNLLNDKIEKLRKYNDFNKQYTKLYDVIDELEVLLDDAQKDNFNSVSMLPFERPLSI